MNSPLSVKTRPSYRYFAPLTFLIFLAAPENLLDIPTSFMLKNQLKAGADQVSVFRLLTGIPLYLSFAFGLVRDLWNPFGLRDRGYFFLFVPLAVGALLWWALWPLNYRALFLGMILVMSLFRFIMAAYEGLIALTAQETLAPGRMSALSNFFMFLPIIVATSVSGYMTSHFSPGRMFVFVAGVVMTIGLFAFWKPRSVFSHVYDNPLARRTGFVRDAKRLITHWPIYPAVVINFLWNFMPGMNTPLQYYLTNHLHGSDAAYATFQALYLACMLLTILLYGRLCKKAPLGTLLWWAAILGVPSLVPLALVHSVNLALTMAVPIGLLSGFATAAFIDLAIRSCPPGLQGTVMMVVVSVIMIALRGSDLVGSMIYGISPNRGFLYCVIATTAVYAAILLVIPSIPRQLVATADGEPKPPT